MQTRRDHINSLIAAIPSAAIRGESIIDVGLRLISGKVLTVRIELGPDFPQSAPVLKILDPGVQHAWLDAFGKVMVPTMYEWNPYSSSLVDTVNAALTEFCMRPPQLPSAVQQQQQQQLPHRLNSNNGSRVSSSSATLTSSHSFNNGGAPAAPPPQQEEAHDIDLPPVPTVFPELATMSSVQLQALLDNDRAYLDFFRKLENVTGPTSLVESIRQSNVELAKKNLDRKRDMDMLKARVEATRESINGIRREFQALVNANSSFTQRFSTARVAKELEELAKTIDGESEDVAATFGTTENLDAAIDRFKKLRTLYHLRMAKAERLKAQ